MPSPSPTGLLERDGELEALDGALARARGARTGSVVLVAGEAGIGKSTLVNTWAHRLAGTDTRLLTGWCDDFLTGRTLGPLRDVARSARGPLAEAVAAADTGAVFDAVLDVLDDPLRPVVLVLEDVHWADEATLDVVRYVGRRITALPAVLVLTYRDDGLGAESPLTGVLASLATASLVRVTPQPLTQDGVATLLADGAVDPVRVAAITGGNPFFVTELARTATTDVPTTVTDAVLARAGALPADVREALDLLSVIPGAVEPALAHVVVGDLGRLAAAERHGLLVTTAEGIRFRHELARRAVEGALTVIERTAAHRRVLEALLRDGDDTGVALLHHAVGAGATDVVAEHGPAAAAEAFRAGAHRQAVVLGEQVLAHAEELPEDEHARVLEQHAWALYNLHRFADAIEVSRQAVALRERLGDPAALARALLIVSRMSYIANDPPAARAAMDRALDVAAEVDDDVLAAEVLVNRVQLLVLTDEDFDASGAAQAAVAAAEVVGRPDLVVLARNYRGMVRANGGDRHAGLTDLRVAVRLGREAGVLEPTARTYTNLVEELLRGGRWDDADAAMDEALAYYEDHDFVSHRYNTEAQRGLLWLWRGRWQEAERLFLDLRASIADAGVLEALSLNGLARLAVWRGDEEAGSLVERLWRVALTSRSAQYIVTSGGARLEHAWLNDRPELVDETLALALDPLAPVRHRGMLLRVLQISGLRPDVEVRPEEFPEPYRSGLAGDWRHAADEWDALGAIFPRALELASSGEVEPMLEALTVFDELGAVAVARWLRQRLRDLGVRSIPRGPQSSTRRNPAGLTDRQLDVLELVAEGLTNAEIAERLVLSVRTVDHHVSAVLHKLDVSSRQDAAEAAGLTSANGPSSR